MYKVNCHTITRKNFRSRRQTSNDSISSSELLRLWLNLMKSTQLTKVLQTSFKSSAILFSLRTFITLSFRLINQHQKKRHSDLLQLLTIQAQLCLQPLRAFGSPGDQIFCSSKPPNRKEIVSFLRGEKHPKAARCFWPQKLFFMWRFCKIILKKMQKINSWIWDLQRESGFVLIIFIVAQRKREFQAPFLIASESPNLRISESPNLHLDFRGEPSSPSKKPRSWYGCFQKMENPKMDGENNGKPY